MFYFVLQLFVAALINTYLDSSEEETGYAFMTPAQREWVDLNRVLMVRPYERPRELGAPLHSPARLAVFRLVNSPAFARLIYAVIALNAIAMTLEHYGESETWSQVLGALDLACGSIYLAECLLKVLGLGPREYLSHKSNWFDLVIVVSVVTKWVGAALPGVDGRELLAAINALRVLRVLRLFKLFTRLKALINTLIMTLWPFANITGLIGIVYFMYAVLGVTLFGGKADLASPHLSFLSRHVNFDTFPNAVFTLFAMSTGESWNGIARELLEYEPGAEAYAISFVLVVRFVMMSLFVAVILTNYQVTFERSRRPDGVKRNVDEESFQDYNKAWNQLYMAYVGDLRKAVDRLVLAVRKAAAPAPPGSAQSSAEGDAERAAAERAAERAELQRQLKAARALLGRAEADPQRLPADQFAALLLNLKAPLGFRKRSRKQVKFSAAHVLGWIKAYRVPVDERNMIDYAPTLRSLIDIVLLEGEVPTDLESFLKLRLSASKKQQLAELQELTNKASGRPLSVRDVIAQEQVHTMIIEYALRWRLRNLRKHGASNETICRVLEAYNERALERELTRVRGAAQLVAELPDDGDELVNLDAQATAAAAAAAEPNRALPV
jgi:hypothetical protein